MKTQHIFRHYVHLMILIILLSGCSATEATVGNNEVTTGADHVILISIDGFRSEFYQEPTQPTPMLQKMANDGVQADGVRGIFPSLTYPSHTTLVTGSFPETHGIYYNSPFEPEGQSGDWYWEYDKMTTQSLWGLAGENNKVTSSIGWPVTVGAPIDYNIPEVWDPDGEWISAIRRHATPDGFLEEIETYATGKLSGDMFSGQYIMREDRVGAMASYIIKEHQPNVLTIHIVATDYYQHRHGMNHHMVDRAVAAADRAIARMVEAADQADILDRTAFIISGDHGFTNISLRVAPNILLVEEGLMEDTNDRGDWRATFHTGGGTAFLHLRDPDDQEAAQKVLDIIEELPASTRNLFRIVDRDELDELGADPNVPFALAASAIAGFSGARSGDVIRKATGGTHGHLSEIPNMETGFVAWGAGIEESVHVEQIGMEDIAPLAAKLLGLQFEYTDGMVIPGFLE